MRASGNKVARMVKADKFMKMETFMLVNSMMERDQVEDACTLPRNVRSMTENGAMTEDKEKALS